MSCFRVFGVFCGSLLFGDKSEYVVAVPQYRAADNTAMGWKNSNLRTEMTRLLRRAGVSGWPRLFHSVTLQEGRVSRQTELQREFPVGTVLQRLGTRNPPLFFPVIGWYLAHFEIVSKSPARKLLPDREPFISDAATWLHDGFSLCLPSVRKGTPR